jgi:hypothetical protein
METTALTFVLPVKIYQRYELRYVIPYVANLTSRVC